MNWMPDMITLDSHNQNQRNERKKKRHLAICLYIHLVAHHRVNTRGSSTLYNNSTSIDANTTYRLSRKAIKKEHISFRSVLQWRGIWFNYNEGRSRIAPQSTNGCWKFATYYYVYDPDSVHLAQTWIRLSEFKYFNSLGKFPLLYF